MHHKKNAAEPKVAPPAPDMKVTQTGPVAVPLMHCDAGVGVFTLGLGKSTNLAIPNSFVAFPFTGPGTVINGQGKVEFQFTVPDNAAFFRVEPPQGTNRLTPTSRSCRATAGNARDRA